MSATTKSPERLRRELSEIWQEVEAQGDDGPIGQVMDLFMADAADVGAVRTVTGRVLEALAEHLIPGLVEAMLFSKEGDEDAYERFLNHFKTSTEYAVDTAFLLGLAAGREHERRGYRLDA